MQDFLAGRYESPEQQDEDYLVCPNLVELKILLPSASSEPSSVSLRIYQRAPAADVFEQLMDQLEIPAELHAYLALFERVDPTFERIIHPKEVPHAIYVNNFATGGASSIQLRRWLFNPWQEIELCARFTVFRELYVFGRAVDDVNRGLIRIPDKATMCILKAYQVASKIDAYLTELRKLDGYGDVLLPYCKSNTKKEGSYNTTN